MAYNVRVLKDWLDVTRPISDSGRHYLDDEELRGAWSRQRFKFEREQRDLLTLDHDDDSYFGRILKNSPIGYFFIVS